jgi:glycosyltransferase involved in cell wall biosynthesis
VTDVRLSVIVATKGRPTLVTTLASVAGQLHPGDELLVRCSDDGDYGCAARRSLIPRASGSHLAFLDDDDRYARGALAAMRAFAREHPGRIGIFRMRFGDGRLLWTEPVLRLANVSTQVLLVPNRPERLGPWAADNPYNADYEFVRAAAELQGPPIFRKQVVAYARFDRPLPILVYRRLRRLPGELRFRLALRTRARRLLFRRS